MALSGTEADVLNSVVRLKVATKDQIRREIGFSLEYIGFLCRDLVRRGYLTFAKGGYSLAKGGIKTLLAEETPKIDRKLLKEIAGEVAKEISSELKKTVKGVRMPVSIGEIKKEAEKKTAEQIKIKTDFELPVEDESLALESNIDRIGAKLETEKFDIDKSVELFKEIKKKRHLK